jgi:mRNA interferase RelE/StbE
MRYEIILAPQAVADLRGFKANVCVVARDAIEQHLRHQPTVVGGSRIKRLRELSRPQYRLRVGDDLRVFYDVHEQTVEVLGIVLKSAANEWLERHGENDETGGSIGTQG